MFLRESLGVSRDVSICKSHYCRIYVRNLGSWKFFGKQIWPIHFLGQNLLFHWYRTSIFDGLLAMVFFWSSKEIPGKNPCNIHWRNIFVHFGHVFLAICLGHNLARKIPPFPSPGVSAANNCGTLRDLAIFGSTEAKNRTEKIGFSGEKNGVFWKLWHVFVEIFEMSLMMFVWKYWKKLIASTAESSCFMSCTINWGSILPFFHSQVPFSPPAKPLHFQMLATERYEANGFTMQSISGNAEHQQTWLGMWVKTTHLWWYCWDGLLGFTVLPPYFLCFVNGVCVYAQFRAIWEWWRFWGYPISGQT